MMTLQEFLETPEELTQDERQKIVDQAIVLMEQLYVHLPLKRAMHAVDPLQRLKLLKYRLRTRMSERQFYDEMMSIFTELRDMHTQYILPTPYQRHSAVLGFRIQRFLDALKPQYMVTWVDRKLVEDRRFKEGVIVTHWNGTPINRAVDLNAARTAGSNLDARHARGLATMTVRPMGLTTPPDEEWVTVGYLSDGQKREIRLDWRIVKWPQMPSAMVPELASHPLAVTLGIDPLVEAVQRTRLLLLAPDVLELEQRVTNLQASGAPEPGDTGPSLDMAKVSKMPSVLQFERRSTAHGEFGYLRIRSFHVRPDEVDDFVGEVARIVKLLPENGLIVDVRGNPGGLIPAGERLLQIFTSREIEPERLHFINTPLTLKLCEEVEGFKAWKESIDQAVLTGTLFSDGFPIRPDEKEKCNSLGQQYYGPTVLIIDALCYSTTDIFAAGWQDHGIGPILGTDANTGAGGANVVEYRQLEGLLPGQQSPIKPLPKGTSFSLSIRRTTRVGERLGDPVEDLGVVPEERHRHHTTRDDILKNNEDLIACAASILADSATKARQPLMQQADQQENSALVERLWNEVICQRNLAVVDQIIAPDFTVEVAPDIAWSDDLVFPITWSAPPVGPEEHEMRGPDGIKNYVKALHEDLYDIRVHIHEQLAAEGGRIVVRWSAQGRSSGEGMETSEPSAEDAVTTTGISIYSFSGGRISKEISVIKQLIVTPPPQEGERKIYEYPRGNTGDDKTSIVKQLIVEPTQQEEGGLPEIIGHILRKH